MEQEGPPGRMLKKFRLLTHPTPAATLPTRPEPPRQPLRPGTRLIPNTTVANVTFKGLGGVIPTARMTDTNAPSKLARYLLRDGD